MSLLCCWTYWSTDGCIACTLPLSPLALGMSASVATTTSFHPYVAMVAYHLCHLPLLSLPMQSTSPVIRPWISKHGTLPPNNCFVPNSKSSRQVKFCATVDNNSNISHFILFFFRSISPPLKSLMSILSARDPGMWSIWLQLFYLYSINLCLSYQLIDKQ
jgi:hypothetical protein